MPPTLAIDLRSDTVTQPTPAMREAMMAAPLGDDVLHDEPTVARLERRVAELLGKDDAAFVPSGTMANQSAIRAQTQPGDEVLMHPDSHVYYYETGAWAAISGVSVRFVPTPDGVGKGTFRADQIGPLVRPDDHHFPPTRLVIVENTHNRGGGRVWPIEQLRAVSDRAHELGLRVHMDGARLWNAHVASGVPLADIAACADSVSVCFSKGLGCPVGSAVAGDAPTMKAVRRIRKMLGGAMRQSGILAGAALWALENNLARMREDHANARRLAELLGAIPGIGVDASSVETNMVYFELGDALVARFGDAEKFCATMDPSVRMLHEGERTVRAVTHLHISRETVEQAGQRIAAACAG